MDFFSLEDFNVVIVRPDGKIIYSGCQWSAIGEDAPLGDLVYESLTLVARSRMEVPVMRRGAAERFTVPFEGRGVHFCRQNAAQRLSHRQRACAMMPRLGKRGLGGRGGLRARLQLRAALADARRARPAAHPRGGAAPVHPRADRRLCRLYWAQGDLPFGGAEEDGFDREEYSFNESFSEEEFPC